MIQGEIIRKLRNLKGVKQSTLARGLGISQPAYSKIEKSACVKNEKLKQILVILKCSEDDLSSLERILNTNNEAVGQGSFK